MFVGHQTQWNFLKKMVEQDRVPPALLFSGEDGLGKQRVAWEFVKLLNCQAENFSEKPCGKCPSCLLIEKGRHPDVFFLEPQGKEIKIVQIRELQSSNVLKNRMMGFQVFIVKDAHCLNQEAQNCFLKTLEEPWGRTVFILIVSKPEALFSTLRSRCQNIKFYPLSPKEMNDYFSKNFQHPFLEKILFVVEGRPGRALELLENKNKTADFFKILKDLSRLLKGDISERLTFIKNMFAGKEPLLAEKLFLEMLLRYFRWLLWKKIGVQNESAKFADLPDGYSLLKIKSAVRQTENTLFLIASTNVNSRLALENLMLTL